MKNINITKNDLKRIARYEMTFEQIDGFPSDMNFTNYKIDKNVQYQYSLEDLYVALNNIKKDNPMIIDYYQLWFAPINYFQNHFGISKARGENKIHSQETSDDEIVGLMIEEEDYFDSIWTRLEEICDSYDEENILEIPEFMYCFSDFRQYQNNYEKPLFEKEFSTYQKEAYIEQFNVDHRLEKANETEIKLCRKFTEELCKEDSIVALRLKGYACYGGNRLYQCDWYTSRDCMINLYDLTDDAGYANTLGYIYYYGRCNNGIPEYDKAFEMFIVSAANGIFEGMYKLADMYRHGYGCKKSLRTAKNLYEIVYKDCLEKFVNDDDNSFADAALRMGNIYLKGIDTDINPQKAYYYYLQADYANKKRMKSTDFFGNTTVAIGIRKAMDEAKDLLEDDYFVDEMNYDNPYHIYNLLGDNNRVIISIDKLSDGVSLIKAKRVPVFADNYVKGILITEPSLNLCQLTTKITYYATNVKMSASLKKQSEPLLVDFISYNYCDDRYDLYFNNMIIGWFNADNFSLQAKNKSEDKGQKLRLVEISFAPNGRKYDYLCNDDVKVGDKVIVESYNGPVVVEVKNVYYRYEEDLGLPKQQYKLATLHNES